MTRTVILRTRTERDIQSVYEWYESQQPGLGREFLDRLLEKLEILRKLPESSQIIYKNIRRAVLSRFPYVIFYIAEPSRIVVLAILHSSRNPANWPRR